MSFKNLDKRGRVYVMLGIMLGVLLAALDSSIVGTAMPRIINDLHGMEHYSWPFTAYMLCSTLIIPVSGKLADTHGRKRVYLVGIVVFLVASALCGLSQTMMQLIIFRGLQGFGGGIILSSSFAIVGEIYAPRERGKYMGFVASMFGLASVLGPTLGGFITDNLNWQWIFYVNIPLGIIALITIYLALPSHISAHHRMRIDYPGVAVFTLGVLPMLLAFTWGGTEPGYEWTSPLILGLFGFSLAMLILFYFIEKKAANPIIPLTLFQNRIFNVTIVTMFLANAAMFGAIIFLPLFVQSVQGRSATASGTVVTPMMLSFVVASIIVGRLISHTGKYKLISIVGFSFAVFGTFLLSRMDENTTAGQLVINMIILGIGLGATTPTFNIAVQNAFPNSQIGVVTGGVQFFRNMGSTIGSAVLGSVMLATMRERMASGKISSLPAGVQSVIKNPVALRNPETMAQLKSHLPPDVLTMVLMHIRSGLAAAIHDVFFISLFGALIAFGFAFFLKELPLRTENTEHPVLID